MYNIPSLSAILISVTSGDTVTSDVIERKDKVNDSTSSRMVSSTISMSTHILRVFGKLADPGLKVNSLRTPPKSSPSEDTKI